jgi:hypothetical protein
MFREREVGFNACSSSDLVLLFGPPANASHACQFCHDKATRQSSILLFMFATVQNIHHDQIGAASV